MTNIIICGANGKMGQVLAEAASKTDDLCVVAGVDKFPDSRKNSFPVYGNIFDCREQADVVIDFSRPDALAANLTFVRQNNLVLIIATTGFSAEDKAQIAEASKCIPVFFSANMSLGVNLQMELAKKAAEFLGEAFDIEIVEKHHNQKVDAPSGTALAIAEYINEAFPEPKDLLCGRCTKTQKRGREIGIHAVRGGTITGDHSVMFIGTDEIIEINHIAQSRQIFAFGALRAAKFLSGKPAGLYNMNDIISESAVTHISRDDNQAMVTLTDIPFSSKTVADIFSGIAVKGIKLDIISQTAPRNGFIALSFSMPRKDMEDCLNIIKASGFDIAAVITNISLCKLSIEGTGMKDQSGVASRLFHVLAEKNIGIHIISTSETKISFCVDTQHAADAVHIVSDAFCI